MCTFFFDLCYLVLEDANVKCEHHHLLAKKPFLMFNANANADVSVANPDFQKRKGGIDNSQGRCINLLFLQNLCRNYMKMKEFGPRRGHASLPPPLWGRLCIKCERGLRQGSHSDWKTWKNGKAFSSQGKVREF